METGLYSSSDGTAANVIKRTLGVLYVPGIVIKKGKFKNHFLPIGNLLYNGNRHKKKLIKFSMCSDNSRSRVLWRLRGKYPNQIRRVGAMREVSGRK